MQAKILLAVLLSFLILLPIAVSARGTGTQADPFRIKSLVYDAYFVSQGGGGFNMNGAGVLSTSGGTIVSAFDRSLNNGANTVSIASDWGHVDCCASSCDRVMAVLRIGEDADNNIIYTDNSWSSQGTLFVYSCGWDLPWTNNEKCLNSDACYDGTCCMVIVSRTFYVLLVENVPPTVAVVPMPSTALTNWQNSDAVASVYCTDNPGGSGCNTSSYRLLVYASNPGSCSTNYNDYTLSPPQTITSHAWVCAAAIDNEENIGFSSPAEFLIEKTPPTGTISIQNGAAYTTSGSVTLSLTYSDTGGSGIHPQGCRYSNDGTWDTEPWEGCTTTKSWTLQPGQGERTVYYQVRDNAGNTYVSSDTIEYDIPPSVTITGMPSGWVNTDRTATITCIDSGTGCDQNSYKFKTYTSSPPSSCPTDYNQYQPTDPVYNKMPITSQTWVCGAAKDNAGNWNYTAAPSNFLIDKAIPAADIKNVSSTWIRSNNLTLSCSDSVSGCQQTIYYSFVPSPGSDCQNGGNPTTSGFIIVNSDHNDYICIRVSDNAGNIATKVSSQLFVDGANPTTTDNVNPNIWYGSPARIKLTCSDAMSGCSKTYYCIDNQGGTCTPSIQSTSAETPVDVTCGSGQQTCSKIIRYYSEDAAGNREVTKSSGIIKIDTTLPVCTITSHPNAYTTTNQITVSWQASSTGSPIANVIVEKMEGSGSWSQLVSSQSATGSNTISNAVNGVTYSFRCKATNQIGVESSYSSVVSTTVDTIPPAVSITANPIVNITTFIVSWPGDDLESGISNYTVFYKTGSSPYSQWAVFQPSTTSAVFGQNGLPLAPQNGNTYTFKVRASDNAGNTKESNEVPVMVDTNKPTCMIQDMPAYQSSSDFMLIWSGADGESGVKEYIVEQRTASLWMQFHRGPETSKDIINANDGTYRFRCRAIDNANNMGDLSAEKSTTVDMNPPEAQMNFSSSVYVNDSLSINARITDAIRVSNVTLYYENAVVPGTATQNPNYSVWDVSWTISGLVTTGMKTFTISVQDVNGNSRNYSNQFLVAYCTPGEVIQGCKCGTGTKTCRNDGTWSECTGVTKQPTTEVCDGEDNDCLGIIDDVNGGNSIQSTQCQCFGSSLLAATNEICDGIDNDCDGQIDENGNCCNEGDIQPCGTDIGICSNKKKTCAGGTWGPCTWEQGPGPTDICGNGLDDNCNGEIDENCASCTDRDGDGYGDPASNQCTYSGQDCDDSNPNVNPGSPEVCDGMDNNCNGQIDEGLSCNMCTNGVQDSNEEGTDCGGDCPPCFVWGWLFLTAGGVVILLILAFVWFHFRKQGRELTWEELKKKWTPSE
ncbi:MAG: MopE-related protein [Candidatus Aenigmarchaeota archaeon]|nr:MopE-related protein [Candidatus Aenigmarchaeota archaeon]